MAANNCKIKLGKRKRIHMRDLMKKSHAEVGVDT